MVVGVAKDFIQLYLNDGEGGDEDALSEIIFNACWGHDLCEDARTSYNDIKKVLGQNAADIIYAVTNEKGKTRSERANDKYYEGIRNTEGAVFVKMCDRIANVQYSKMTKSRMYDVYKKENEHFITQLGFNGLTIHPYKKMCDYLLNLLKD